MTANAGQTKVYGAANPASYTYTSAPAVGAVLANLDVVGFTGSQVRAGGENVGTYAISQGNLANSNYNITYTGGTFTITQLPVTVTANAGQTKVYGAANPASYTYTSAPAVGAVLANLDVVGFTGSQVRAGGENVGPYAISQGNLANSNYNITYNGGTFTITAAPVVASVSVSPANQQYSDKVSYSSTLIGGAPLVIGGPQAAVSATFKVGTQVIGTAPFIVSGLNLVASLDDQPLLEPSPFGTAPTGQMAPGIKTVTAVINSPHSNYSLSSLSPSTALTITQEDATIEYTGDIIKATATATTTSAVITLRANVLDISVTDPSDSNAGDIRNAKVMFVNRDAGNAPISGWIPVSTLVNASDTRIGTASFNWTVNLGIADDVQTTVGIVVDNGYYIRNSPTDNVVVIVYKPNGDFITGGGHITPTLSVGSMKADVGAKTNFGFNVKFNKSGTNLKGNMNIIFRRTENDGKQHVYQIKANAMQSLGVNATNANRQTANYVSKTNLTDITNPLVPVSMGGNKFLHVNMVDNGEPGSKDSISFVLVDGSADPTVLSNIIYSSNWISSKTQMMNLRGGNLVVHSGFNLGVNSPAARTAAPEITLIQPVMRPGEIPFSIKAYPNPSERFFTLKVAGNATEEVKIKVYDIVGRQVFIAKGTANQLYVFGELFVSGTYIVEVRQGVKRSTITLIKN